MQLIVNSLVAGMTGSGKSQLVKFLVASDEFKAKPLGVHDPAHDPTWDEFEPSIHTDSDQDFLAWYWSNMDCVCVFDEAHESISLTNRPMISTATKGRHWRHRNFYISNGVIGLATKLRGNCSEVYAFRCSKKDGEDLADMYDCKELADCRRLREFEFFHLVLWGPDGRPVLSRGKAHQDGIQEEFISIIDEGQLPAAVPLSLKGGETA